MIDAVGNPQSVLLLGGTSEIGLAIVRGVRDGPPDARGPRRAARRSASTPPRRRVEKLGCAVETIDFDARAVDTHADVVRKAFAGGDVDVAVVAFGLLGDAEGGWTDVDAAVELAHGELHRGGLGRRGAGRAVARAGPRRDRRAVVGRRRAGAAVELRLRLHEGRDGRVLHGLDRGAAPVRDGRHGRPARLRAHADDRGDEAAPLSTTPEAVAGERRGRRARTGKSRSGCPRRCAS